MDHILARYDDLCEVFGLRHTDRDHLPSPILYRLPDDSLFLDAGVLNWREDEHALAFACSLLANSRVSHHLIFEFITTYWKVTNSITRPPPTPQELCAVRPHVQHVLGKHHDNNNFNATNQGSAPWAMWRFKDCKHLTGDSIAMLIAAAIICGNGKLELDFTSCEKLFTLDLVAWAGIVTKINSTLSSPVVFGLGGIRFDLCPLRSFGNTPEKLLDGLKWISLRETKLRNLWTVSGFIRSIKTLGAVLIAGEARSSKELRIVSNVSSQITCMPRAARRSLPIYSPHASTYSPHAISSPKRKMARHDGVNNTDNTHGSDAGTFYEPLPPPSQSSKPLTADNVAMDIDTGDAIPYLTHAQFMDNQHLYDLDEDEPVVKDTPVSLKLCYREFILAHARPELRNLDGEIFTASCVDRAKQNISQHYEVTLPSSSPKNTPSNLHRFLRNREMEMTDVQYKIAEPTPAPPSKIPRRGGRQSTHIAASTPTPKRRRNGDYDTTAGCVSAPAMNNNASMESVLGDALRNGNNYFKADRYLGTLSKIRSGSSSLTWQSSGRSASSGALSDGNASRQVDTIGIGKMSGGSVRYEPQPVTHSVLQGVNFDARRFEGACVTEFLRRPGRPKVEYLCGPEDRPRQFEYNHVDTRLLVYGTEHANLVVLNQENMTIEGSCRVGGGRAPYAPGTAARVSSGGLPERPPYEPIFQDRTSVLGLSWFNKDANLFIAGCEDGTIQIYNVERMRNGSESTYGFVREAPGFHKLTSLHANCTDDKFVVSGYSKDVGVYDIATGAKLETMAGCHKDHINVLKFSYHDPHIFVTSSFDKELKKWDLRERRPGGMRRPIFTSTAKTGNVMVCWSHDDRFILGSGSNNDVTQYNTSDGRVDREFNLSENTSGRIPHYTRSYYMNGRDYIISGSCNEDIVRIYNARTGQRAGEIDMDNRLGNGRSRWGYSQKGLFVQSLRSNPRKNHNFSVLLSSNARHQGEGNYYCIANVDLYARE